MDDVWLYSITHSRLTHIFSILVNSKAIMLSVISFESYHNYGLYIIIAAIATTNSYDAYAFVCKAIMIK